MKQIKICKTWDCELPVRNNRSSYCSNKCNVRSHGYIQRHGGDGTPNYDIRKCKYSKCNVTFSKNVYNRVYCSKKCSERKEDTETTLNCSWCDKQYTRVTRGLSKDKNTFCSQTCASSFHSREHTKRKWEKHGKITNCSDCGVEFEKLQTKQTRCPDCMYKYWKWNAYEKMVKNKPCKLCGEKNTFLVGRSQAKVCILCYQNYAAQVGWKITDSLSGDLVKKDKFDVECIKCGLQHRTSFYYITQGHGCPECAVGFNIDEPALLYWMDAGTGWKFGITQHFDTRVKYQHEKAHGLKYLEHINFDTGKEAQQVERKIIEWMKENKIQRISKTIFQYSGHTEVISKSKYYKKYSDTIPVNLKQVIKLAS